MPTDQQDQCEATPSGLMQCLRMLVDEAALLRLPHTMCALKDALEACRSETLGQRPDQVAHLRTLLVH